MMFWARTSTTSQGCVYSELRLSNLSFGALLAKVYDGGAQRGARYLNKSVERGVQLQNHEDRAGDRQRRDEQSGDRCRIAGCEKSEADEDNRKPQNQHHQE